MAWPGSQKLAWRQGARESEVGLARESEVGLAREPEVGHSLHSHMLVENSSRGGGDEVMSYMLVENSSRGMDRLNCYHTEHKDNCISYGKNIT